MENYQSQDFQNVVYQKFVQIPVIKLLKNLISSSILIKDTKNKANWLLTFSLFLMHFMSFINYRKSKTIFKSSLNSPVYWDTLYL